ncbi:hypothetical protein ASE36_04065 [Rhizobium sp. Root274]|nr:hypothetical protein ASC71_04070 [Rhizobium sp. Root1240]KRD32976.1 hypothetical protein ASE36_04065 [Rhizobium sp. Root274]
MRDIVENGVATLEYTGGLDFDGYRKSKITRDATERCLSRISEAGVKLGQLAEELFPNHDWLAIRNLGNVLRHNYPGVLDSVIWTTVTLRLPPLLADLNAFLSQYPHDQEVL